MVNHLDEMKFFLEVAQAYSSNTLLESHQPVVEDIPSINDENTNINLSEDLLTDLTELKESWLSINSNENDPNYSMGYEQGLYKAVEMLENLLSSKYDRRI